MTEPLFAGLKVVDASTVIAAPAAAMMLADFGADVVKIERPGRGDMLRFLSNMPGANNYMWTLDGRNKKSIALDLKTEAGLKVLHQLATACDVFITNMPYPSRESFNLTYDDIQQLNPNVIYASLTAYGEKGAERDRKGFDQLAYWARSGLMDLMREPGTVPAQGLPGMGDHPTAISIYAGIVTALLKRERTGEGSFVQTSLLANGLWSVSAVVQGVMAGGDMSRFRQNTRNPGYTMRVYRAKDDRWLQMNMVRNEELMSLMFTALDLTHVLADERFQSLAEMYKNRDVLGDLIQETIATKTSDEWLAIFANYDLPINRIAIVEQSKDDPQILANRMASTIDSEEIETKLLVNHPIQISGVPHTPVERAPDLGEHSREVLQDLGYSTEEIQNLIESGAVTESST